MRWPKFPGGADSQDNDDDAARCQRNRDPQQRPSEQRHKDALLQSIHFLVQLVAALCDGARALQEDKAALQEEVGSLEARLAQLLSPPSQPHSNIHTGDTSAAISVDGVANNGGMFPTERTVLERREGCTCGVCVLPRRVLQVKVSVNPHTLNDSLRASVTEPQPLQSVTPPTGHQPLGAATLVPRRLRFDTRMHLAPIAMNDFDAPLVAKPATPTPTLQLQRAPATKQPAKTPSRLGWLSNPRNRDNCATSSTTSAPKPKTKKQAGNGKQRTKVRGAGRRAGRGGTVTIGPSPGELAPSFYVTCDDGILHPIPLADARTMQVFGDMIDVFSEQGRGGADDGAVPMPKIKGWIMAKVVRFCAHQRRDPWMPAHPSRSIFWCHRARIGDKPGSIVAEIAGAPLQEIYLLMRTANYLSLDPLLDLCCQAVAERIVDATTHEEQTAVLDVVHPLEELQRRRAFSDQPWLRAIRSDPWLESTTAITARPATHASLSFLVQALYSTAPHMYDMIRAHTPERRHADLASFTGSPKRTWNGNDRGPFTNAGRPDMRYSANYC